MAERELWRGQLAVLQLTDALDREPRFWDQVEDLAKIEDVGQRVEQARELAKRRYGTGRRRLAITRLLLRACSADRMALDNAAVRFVTVSDDGPSPRPSTYRLGTAFIKPLALGARYIARAGAGLCLVAEGAPKDWCVDKAAEGGRYCIAHDRTEPVLNKDERERYMRKTFDAAVPAVLAGPRSADELQAELDEFTADLTLRNLEATVETLAAAHERRDDLIRDAAGLGVTYRLIGASAGLSEARISEIVKGAGG